ncbi:uncharacterized protein LOC126355671 [Schistocerca gregaria]|uniref:uncharacterized protein LOC126355671 n=1 Tax=Schistocerca gregaria TaxID=7010 RepID=UPI00211F18E7|nr:uncharacterized protein LOC126355671 [Schistocerca gregaria]
MMMASSWVKYSGGKTIPHSDLQAGTTQKDIVFRRKKTGVLWIGARNVRSLNQADVPSACCDMNTTHRNTVAPCHILTADVFSDSETIFMISCCHIDAKCYYVDRFENDILFK